MKKLILAFSLMLSWMVCADEARVVRYGDQRVSVDRVEVVPALPRPVPDPLTGVKPVITVGTSEDYLPDPNKAHHDSVSPTSREHLETMIRDLRKR